MNRISKVWGRHFLGLEALVAILPAVALATWMLWFDGSDHVHTLLHGNRTNIYRTVATLSVTLLGFSLAAASFALNSTSSPRLTVLHQSPHYPTLWKTFFQTVHILGALALTSLVCMIWDRDCAPNTLLLIPFTLFAGLSTIRLARVIWILEQIIGLVSMPPRRDGDADLR